MTCNITFLKLLPQLNYYLLILTRSQYVIALGLMFLLFTSLSAMCLACNSSDLIPLLGKYHKYLFFVAFNEHSDNSTRHLLSL